MWGTLLSMCGGNVLEAMQLEESLTERWYLQYAAWSDAMAEAQKAKHK